MPNRETAMKKSVLMEGMFLLVISFIGLAESIHLVYDIDPNAIYDTLGPGYYILFLSIALMITGVLHIVINYRKQVAALKVEVNKELRRRMIGILLVLALYAVAIDFIGYLISTVSFFILEFRMVGIKSWQTNIILSIFLTLGYYVVFIKYCEMVFPKGVLSMAF
jgi:putative tricarboxylic transport membrane protein